MAWPARRAFLRLQLSRAKHPSLAGHARLSRWMAKQVHFYEYADDQYFAADQAPAAVADQRRAAFQRLSDLYAAKFARSAAATAEAQPTLSDLQFTARYRVPFQFSRRAREALRGGSMLCASGGVQVTDLDGNRFYDLTGSYGANLFGYDFYKQCVDRGIAATRELGPVLGAYHPLIAEVVAWLRRISGLDEVSFHMSGTEAVMQAARLARYHTGRDRLVRFCGAYHGWWGEVQPGVGNPVPAERTYTLRDLDERSLAVLRSRRDIACVLVNPLQALHPNAGAPGDSALLGSRHAGFDREGYMHWLRRLREVCTERGIALIFDEVFLGFRLAPGGAQEYFGVRADLVTYGKTLGGGLPVGVLCGAARFMRRFREQAPADICFARGTFNSHPYVIGAMHEFLCRLDTPEIAGLYANLDETWNARAAALNARLAAAGAPARIANLSSVWTVIYPEPGAYHWMLQYYLRAHDLALSWVGTGRLIFSLNYTQADFEAVAERFTAAAAEMLADGWWWRAPDTTDRDLRRRLLKEMIHARLA